jgi:hypothetical protein
MGIYDGKDINIDITTLSVSDKKKYTDFVGLIASGRLGKVDGTSYSLDVNHVTPEVVTEETTLLEYSLLSNNNKKIITDFEMLLK